MPVRTGGNQRTRRAGVRPSNRLCKQPHSSTVLQDLVGKGVQGRFGISGVELCDDHHTALPLLFIALTNADYPISPTKSAVAKLLHICPIPCGADLGLVG